MKTTTEILKGCYDLHVHMYPEFSLGYKPRFQNEEVVQLMIDAGMKGVVIKSHFWPAVAPAYALRDRFKDAENFTVFGSVTLNACSGGVKPWAVESAIRQDAKIIWFPTWSAKNDMSRGGVSKFIRKYLDTYDTFTEDQWIYLLDENGELTKDAKTTVEMCKDANVALATGHISMDESLAVGAYAKKIGFDKLIVSHPDSHSIGGDIEFVKKMAELGAVIEICALGLTPQYHRITPQQLNEFLQAAGPDRTILSTDYFFEWSSTPTEQMYSLIGSLTWAGADPEDVYTACHETPEYLLGL